MGEKYQTAIRTDLETKKKLEDLATHYDRSMNWIVERLIKQAWKRVFDPDGQDVPSGVPDMESVG
jgi:predicted transcriptional regulator